MHTNEQADELDLSHYLNCLS